MPHVLTSWYTVQTRSGTLMSSGQRSTCLPQAVQDVSIILISIFPSCDRNPDIFPALPSDILSQREAAARQPSPVHRIDNNVQPLPPAPDSRTVVDKDPYATPTSAGDTLQGATSQDVYSGLGKPAGGMSSAEMHHDGQAHRKKQHLGADQYGSGEIPRDFQTGAE